MQAATHVTSVTVYRNGALVVREGLGAGDVEVAGLPLLFSSETLRVRPSAGAVSALEETVRLETAPAPLPPDEAERARVLLDIARVDDELKTCAALLELLQALAPELPDPRVVPEALVDAGLFVDLAAFAGDRASDVLARRHDLERRRRALDRERQRLDERAGVVPAVTPRVFRGARFHLDAPREVPFSLEYFVAAARWVPTYALHLEGGRARFVTAAFVAQATGEDWSNVRLAVSTADLARETTLPQLSSWRIGRAQAAPHKAFRPLPTDLPSLFFGYDHGPRRPTPPAPAPTAPPEPASFERLESDELRSFERERTAANLPALGAAADRALDELSEEGEQDEGAAPPYDAASTKTGMVFFPPPAPPPPGVAPSAPASFGAPRAAAAPMAKRARPGAGGGPPRAQAARDEGERPELPPRLRTASLRMAGPDEPQRGSLLPLDPLRRLEWLLEAFDVDADKSVVQRAAFALRAAQARLEQQPLPRGTSALLGTHFPVVLPAPAKTDVPGDGTFHRVEVRVDEGDAVIEHKAVPRESLDVWRTCRLELAGAEARPAGPLTVYEDGAFRVNARVDGAGGGKPLDVNLGVDPDVRVLSRTVHVSQSEKGIVTSTSRVVHDIELEVRSTKKAPAKVTLFDRLPVPADNVKDVAVNVVEEKPPLHKTGKDARGNEVAGAFEWRLTLMPGDTQKIALRYAIDLPAKAELEGGNRRD